MTKIAVWCRHKDDNIIGIGPQIPWRISSDFKRFRRITKGQTLIAGQTTYESFPNRTLPERKIMVLTFDAGYEVSDKQNHQVVTDINYFKEAEGDFYIAGGNTLISPAFSYRADNIMAGFGQFFYDIGRQHPVGAGYKYGFSHITIRFYVRTGS